jgi:hypothetical protein
MFNNFAIISVLCFLISACGGSSNDGEALNHAPVDDFALCDNYEQTDAISQTLKQDGFGIVKSFPAAIGGIYYLQETLSDLKRFPGQRSLKRLDCDWSVSLEYSVEDEQSLIDFVEHPSGELSLIIIAAENYQLYRLSSSGAVLAQTQVDGLTAPVDTGDVADLAEVGEDILLAAKHSDLSVKLLRYQYASATGFSYQWDTVVEPATSAFGWIMHGGSYDAFEQLAQPYNVSLATDAGGNSYIAVAGLSALLFNHNEYFSENLEFILHTDERMNNWPQLDSIVTKVSASGERIYSVVAGTNYPDEVYGISVFGESMYVFGRSTRQAGNFWDGFVTKMKTSSGEIESSTILDIQNGDIVYDVIELASGNLFAVGATNWTQNPSGFSVSENSEKLAVLLDSSGQFIERYDIADGERHNQLRSVTSLGHDWLLISGLDNGPGTHSGDSDRNLVRADGYLQTFKLPQ